AENAGALKTTPQQTVSSDFVGDRSYTTIEPAEPSLLYVPSYEPADVYQPVVAVAPVIAFGVGIVVGAPLHRHCWNWRTGAIYPPAWAGYPGGKPGQPAWLGGRPVGGNIKVGNNPKPWRPGPDYRPRLGPGVGVNSPRGASIMVDRSPDGTTISIRSSSMIDRPGGGNITANTRPGAGAFVNTRPAGNFVNGRPAGGVNVFGHPNGANVIDRAPGVVAAPRVAPVLPNLGRRVAPAMSSIRPGVGAIPSNRAVIGRGPASGGPVGGAMARPGGFGGGGFGGALR